MGTRHQIPTSRFFQKKKKMSIISKEFYQRGDVVAIARKLLGKWLFTQFKGEELTGGIIIETEAYAGPDDRASHAYNNRRTKRTEVLFGAGGHAYVHLCYGIHHMLNVVVSNAGTPHGVLIRAIQPTYGLETMVKRRRKKTADRTLTSGPGALCEALGITMDLYGHDLTKPPLWIEERNTRIAKKKIVVGPRVGVEYAKEHALLPWRFKIDLDI
jgi:DNA-3-methyladenine glycosylase